MAGQIIKKGERRYLVRVFIGRGLSRRKYRGVAIEGMVKKYRTELVHGTQKDAQRVLRTILSEKDTGHVMEVSRDTVDEFLDRWLETAVTPSVRTRTLEDYKGILARYVRPRIGSMRVEKVDTISVDAIYAGMLASGLSPRSVFYTHAVLGAAFSWGVRKRKLHRNPTEAADLPARKRTEMTPLDADQVGKLLDAARGTDEYAVLAMAASTGMRPSEYLALRWTDLEGTRISVQRTLSRRGKVWSFEDVKRPASRRSVELDPKTLADLQRHKAAQAARRLSLGDEWKDQGLIFPDDRGGPERERTLVGRFKRLLKRATLPDVRLYDLRHSYATIAIRAGVPVKVVSERVGHADPGFTMRVYQHVLPGMQKEAAALVADLIYAKGGRNTLE